MGGNAVGIFVHSVQNESLADSAGLRTGDQILEYNGADLRHATAEEAAYELAKPADKVTVLAHYKLDSKYFIKLKPYITLCSEFSFCNKSIIQPIFLMQHL